MTEVLFYHLQHQPLDAVLPGLLEKCLERQWRAVVQGRDRERIDALNDSLWSYRDDAFLPHGIAGGKHDGAQPILLTDGPGNANEATVRFLVDRADPPDLNPYQRAVFIFDGNDEEALADARLRWKEMKSAGHQVTYWQQSDRGGWVKKA